MFQRYKFQLDDATYEDNVRTNPAHYNSMREKPIYPPALIENNIRGLKCFPNTWMRTKNEWKYFRDDRQFKKRCLFNVEKNERIHLASLDSISNQHLLSSTLKLPHEDDVFRAIGQKRNLINKRNGFEEFSPGDKSYRSCEYSTDFFKRKNRNWRNEKINIPKKSDETFPDLAEILSLNQRTISAVFSNHVDYDYEQDNLMEKRDELNAVKCLDTWRPISPLQMPFKVLDLGDKALRYRPKVTR